MATEFNWTINNIKAYPTLDNQTNVIFEIHWECAAYEPSEIVDGKHIPSYNSVYRAATNITYDENTTLPIPPIIRKKLYDSVYARTVYVY